MVHDPAPGGVAAALGLPAVVAARRMTGFDATVWRCELADGSIVALRLLPIGRPGGPEVAALDLAARHGQPAPEVLMVGHVAGRACLATTWCPGRPIADLLIAGDRRALGVPFGRAQARMHRPVDGEVLCHLDYHPFNVLVADGADAEPSISGIVDWTNARIDDPRTDLATTRMALDLAPVVMPSLNAAIDDFRAQWQQGYASTSRMPRDDELAPFLAAAAARQVRDWSPRAGEHPVAAAVVDRARALQRTYSG